MKTAGTIAVSCLATLIGCVSEPDLLDEEAGDEPIEQPSEPEDVPTIEAGNPDKHPTYYSPIEKSTLRLVHELRAAENKGEPDPSVTPLPVLRVSAQLTQLAFEDATAMAATATQKQNTANRFYVVTSDEGTPAATAQKIVQQLFLDETSYVADQQLYGMTTRTVGIASVTAPGGNIYTAVLFGKDPNVALLSIGPATIAKYGGFETQTTWPTAAPADVRVPGIWHHNNNAYTVLTNGYAGSKYALTVSDASGSSDTASQIAKARPGVYYRVNAFVRASFGNSGSQTISLGFLDANFKLIALADNSKLVTVATGNKTTWTERMTPDVKAPAGTAWVRVTLGDITPEEQGTVDYDNVRLVAY